MDSGVPSLRRHLLFKNYLYNLMILIAMRFKNRRLTSAIGDAASELFKLACDCCRQLHFGIVWRAGVISG
jgi:hypothetical protein